MTPYNDANSILCLFSGKSTDLAGQAYIYPFASSGNICIRYNQTCGNNDPSCTLLSFLHFESILSSNILLTPTRSITRFLAPFTQGTRWFASAFRILDDIGLSMALVKRCFQHKCGGGTWKAAICGDSLSCVQTRKSKITKKKKPKKSLKHTTKSKALRFTPNILITMQ